MELRKDKRRRLLILAPVLVVMILAAAFFAQGCKDQAKQDFVDGILSIIEENQAQPEIAEKGSAAFQAYAMSGFTDLESAQAAADSFALSNEKDQATLARLDALNRPDEQADAIAEMLEGGIVMMDEGNAIYTEELEKAPGQSVEERAMVFEKTASVMGLYLEGLDTIIASFEKLLEYAKDNGLDGVEDVESWVERFKEEKKSMERAMQYM